MAGKAFAYSPDCQSRNSKLLLQSKLVLVRNNNDGSRLIKVDRDEWNIFLGQFQLQGDVYRKGGRV